MNRKKTDISVIFIIALFLFAGIVSWRIYFRVYRQEDSINIHYFPKTIEGWNSEEIPVTDDEKALLETDNVFVRRYTNTKGEEIFLFIVYSQNNRKVSHPPEICYTGGGATILNSVHDSFGSVSGDETGHVNRLTVEKGGVTQIFAYWFKVGDTFTSNYWKQQGLIAWKSLLEQTASNALIRISSTFKYENYSEATKLIKEFGRLMIPYLHQYLP